MATKLKVGDKVTLYPKCEWVSESSKEKTSTNPLNIIGVIDEIDSNSSLPIHVKWNNGNSNSYYRKDLIKQSNNKEMTKKPVKVKPLDSFHGWSIKRNKGIISFGCGAVKLSARMLKKFMEAKNSVEVIHYINRKKDLARNIKSKDVTPRELRSFADLLENKPDNYKLLDRLTSKVKRHYRDDITKISDKTILGIIG